ncbi:MAG TPA: MerR family transcriptional regulator, partial [Gemmataceae bacterium]|nr:MerR family transcriptional regulator [Gemmataceae bacterium]
MADGSETANWSLQGQKIALIGSFANRSRLIEVIQYRGGQLVSSITSQTTLLVVGQERWPITKEGRLSPKVVLARRLQAHGSLTILTENDLLDRLGQERPPLGSCELSASQLSHLLKVSEARLRRWVQAGLLQPRTLSPNTHLYDFQQVQCAKRLRDLCKSGASLKRLRRTL